MMTKKMKAKSLNFISDYEFTDRKPLSPASDHYKFRNYFYLMLLIQTPHVPASKRLLHVNVKSVAPFSKY